MGAADRRAAAALVALRRRDPLSRFAWLPPQLEFLRAPERRVLFRAGNQVFGKTTAGLAKVVDLALGTDRWGIRPPWRPPVEAWVICASMEQSVNIQQKLHALLPAGALADPDAFDPVRGFRGRHPAAVLRNGSIIRVKTTGQGGLNLAGATIHAALFDEPPRDARIYTEVLKRTQHTGGYVWLTLTPINAPTDWLRELVEAGQVRDIHYPLAPEHLIPVGRTEPIRLTDGTVCDEAWCRKIREETPPYELPVVVDGEWETRVVGRVFRAFTDEHIVDEGTYPDSEAVLALGIDYGTKVGRQVAILCAVEERGDGEPRVWVLDEAVSADDSAIEDDARQVLGMLAKHGLRWTDLDVIYGDRILYARVGSKSNKELMKAIARMLGLTRWQQLRPGIRTVKVGAGRLQGSVEAGTRWLHQCMVRRGPDGRPDLMIARNCVALREAMERWDYRSTSPYKDAIDALRYAVWRWTFGARRSRAVPRVIVAR